MADRIRILIFQEYYLPGYKGGGPTRTISNLVAALSGTFDLWIVTKDRDASDKKPFENVRVNEWQLVGGAHLYYASPHHLGLLKLRALVHSVAPQVLYLNNFFSPAVVKIQLLAKLGLLRDYVILLAPRGSLNDQALQLKSLKKRLYLAITKLFRFYDRPYFQASSEDEIAAIQMKLGAEKIEFVPNIASVPPGDQYASARAPKAPGTARFVCISRVSRMKNLRFAIEILSDVRGPVAFDVYGPLEDESYWADCEMAARALNSEARVRYCGALNPDRVLDTLTGYHFFLMPTLGESFGHSILEALMVGCPVLLSDQTPWHRLDADGAGWEIGLDDRVGWRKVIQRCVDMGDDEYQAMSSGARMAGLGYAGASDAAGRMAELFARLGNEGVEDDHRSWRRGGFKQAARRLLDRPGRRGLLALAGTIYVTVRRGQMCRVRFADGRWFHHYSGTVMVCPSLDTTTPRMWDTFTRDLFFHGYVPKVGDTIIEIGAGTGSETVVLSRLVGETGRVVAVEAHPRTFACLEHTCELNGLSNVSVLNAAACDESGEVDISDLDEHLSNTVLGASGRSLRVPAITLDEIVATLGARRIAFLKMNIEGAEGRAIQGMKKCVSIIDNVCIACHDFWAPVTGIDEMRTKATVREFLIEHGFEIVTREGDHRAWVRDYLYGHANRPGDLGQPLLTGAEGHVPGADDSRANGSAE